MAKSGYFELDNRTDGLYMKQRPADIIRVLRIWFIFVMPRKFHMIVLYSLKRYLIQHIMMQ